MATHVTEHTVSDLDPTGMAHADETVRFSLDGISYEIDLTSREADEFREVNKRYTAAGRVVTIPRKPGRDRTKAGADRSQTARAWIRQVGGHDLSDKGRIPEGWMQQYRDAGSPKDWPGKY